VTSFCRLPQVSLFKRNFHHVVPDSYFKNYHQVARGNPNYFTTYGNGKAAARMHDGVRPNGAHRWYSYVKTPKYGSPPRCAFYPPPSPGGRPVCPPPSSLIIQDGAPRAVLLK